MKINETIRQRRIERNLTQEQVANYLGVTAPAVNKWEKGTSYPDITTLPALARILETDLNTLLSFKEELTEQEIAIFLNTLSELLEKEGFLKVYEIAMEKIREYPVCYPLLLNVAMFLEGAGMYSKEGKKDLKIHKKEIEALYHRVLNSPNQNEKNYAQSMLISKYIQRKEYEKAEEMLQSLPEKTSVDKKQLQINLFLSRGKLEEAAKLEEEKLFSSITEIQSVLLMLMEIALKQERKEDAEYFAEVSKQAAKLFDLWEYYSYAAHFQLYLAQKDRVKCLKILFPMMKALTKSWEINQSPLYRHIKTKKTEKGFGLKLRKALVQELCEDEEASFLKEREDVQKLLKEAEADEKM